MTELCTKLEIALSDVLQIVKNNGFEYRQSYITFETYFSHTKSVLDIQTLLENSVVIKYNQNAGQSFLVYKHKNCEKNQNVCTQIDDAKIAKQILCSSGHFAWCEYTCTNTIFEKQNLQINICGVFGVGDFLQIKSNQKTQKQLVEIIKQLGIKTQNNFNQNIAVEYYKKNYEENI